MVKQIRKKLFPKFNFLVSVNIINNKKTCVIFICNASVFVLCIVEPHGYFPWKFNPLSLRWVIWRKELILDDGKRDEFLIED